MTLTNWYVHPPARQWRCPPAPTAVAAFHTGLPGFRTTPLVELPPLARELGVGRLFVKDESTRLGLPAFKILGASWASYQVLSRHLGLPEGADIESMRRGLEKSAPVELVTATDGNHGRAVAWMARQLCVAAQVYVSTVVPSSAAEAIASEGATVTVVDGSYDDAVRAAHAAAQARETRLLIQDTSWAGYEEVPRWIVDGYSTLLREIDAQLSAAGAGPPDLVAVPVGVGSLAQAVIVHYRGTRPTALLSVEPTTAACVLASLQTGELRSVSTASTIMAGLNCGTPSAIAWPYLRDGLDAAIAVSDADAVQAMGQLASLGLAAGACGAASLAGARAALGRADRRTSLEVDTGSTVVLLNTEGSTTHQDLLDHEDAAPTSC